MSKHTPGLWSVADYKQIGTGDYVVRSAEKGPDDPFPVVACVTKRPGHKANASLIAAAPDLLEALKLMLVWARQADVVMYGNTALRTQPPNSFAEANAAITKAEGK